MGNIFVTFASILVDDGGVWITCLEGFWGGEKGLENGRICSPPNGWIRADYSMRGKISGTTDGPE